MYTASRQGDRVNIIRRTATLIGADVADTPQKKLYVNRNISRNLWVCRISASRCQGSFDPEEIKLHSVKLIIFFPFFGIILKWA